MKQFIAERFPEFNPTQRTDDAQVRVRCACTHALTHARARSLARWQLSSQEIATKRMAERDAMLAKVMFDPESIGGASSIPQLEFVSAQSQPPVAAARTR